MANEVLEKPRIPDLEVAMTGQGEKLPLCGFHYAINQRTERPRSDDRLRELIQFS
jgi:hypothetical protein